jgi:hypothetical protein
MLVDDQVGQPLGGTSTHESSLAELHGETLVQCDACSTNAACNGVPTSTKSTSASSRFVNMNDALSVLSASESSAVNPNKALPSRRSSAPDPYPKCQRCLDCTSDPTTQVVGGVGSGLRPAVQSPLQSAGGGGGRGQHFEHLRVFACPAGCPLGCLTGLTSNEAPCEAPERAPWKAPATTWWRGN